MPSPYQSDFDGEWMVVSTVTIPIMQDDTFLGAVGVDISLDAIAQELNAATVMEDGYMVALSSEGAFVIHPNAEYEMTDYRDSWLGDYSVEIENIIANGGSFQVQGNSSEINAEVIVTGSALPFAYGDSNWVVASVVPMSTVNVSSSMLTALIIIAGVAIIISVSLLLYRLIKKNLRGLSVLEKASRQLSEGDIDVYLGDVPKNDTKNKIDNLKKSFRKLIESTKEQVYDMQRIAGKDFSFTVTPRSDKDLLNQAIREVLIANNRTFQEIHSAAGQVAARSAQVSKGAQALAQGATQQSATVQELAETLSMAAHEIQASAAKAMEASDVVRHVGDDMNECNIKMQAVMRAMENISVSSQKIGNIIKTIEDIAFQTNILALNAAVEAARAGDAGKGFAVVADEVRSLASKSAEASKNTAQLIEESIQAVKEGTGLVDETANTLVSAVKGAEQVVRTIQDISDGTSSQTDAVVQVQKGVNEISAVVQMNSATAEESAAASEELLGQANLLNDLVGQYKLTESGVRDSDKF